MFNAVCVSGERCFKASWQDVKVLDEQVLRLGGVLALSTRKHFFRCEFKQTVLPVQYARPSYSEMRVCFQVFPRDTTPQSRSYTEVSVHRVVSYLCNW